MEEVSCAFFILSSGIFKSLRHRFVEILVRRMLVVAVVEKNDVDKSMLPLVIMIELVADAADLLKCDDLRFVGMMLKLVTVAVVVW